MLAPLEVRPAQGWQERSQVLATAEARAAERVVEATDG
jgi:hypothetical protein